MTEEPLALATAAALSEAKRRFRLMFAVSAAVNLLLLAGPLYMLQVYDRVLPGGSLETLAVLSFGLGAALAAQVVFDGLRGRIAVQIGRGLEERISPALNRALFRQAVTGQGGTEAARLQDAAEALRRFTGGPALAAFADLPWLPVFFLILFAVHPLIGGVTLAGGLILLGIAIAADRAQRMAERRQGLAAAERTSQREAARRNAETVTALGMQQALASRMERQTAILLEAADRAGDAAARAGARSRVLRQAVQSAVLCAGAWLAVAGELTAGAMIAAAILSSRALMPLESFIAHLREAGAAVAARNLLNSEEHSGSLLPMALPRPETSLEVEHALIAAPGGRIVISGLTLSLKSGAVLGVVGPSGAGKSALAKTLAGIWPAARGTIRLDGSDLAHFADNVRGRFTGYLGQDVALFEGTIAENIARFDPEAREEAIIAAAQAAGAHAMIQRLPFGYRTRLGEGGAGLSGGQRQRIGLARALYGDPFLVILDEPNAHLDAEGEAALAIALDGLKARGAIAIVMSHRPAALARCSTIMVLGDGRVQAIGERTAILKRLMSPAPAQPPLLKESA